MNNSNIKKIYPRTVTKLSVNLDAELRERLEKYADQEFRSASAQAAYFIRMGLDAVDRQNEGDSEAPDLESEIMAIAEEEHRKKKAVLNDMRSELQKGEKTELKNESSEGQQRTVDSSNPSSTSSSWI